MSGVVGVGWYVWASYLFCYQEKSYVLSAHGLKLQREVASDKNLCFLQKTAWIGESPWSHCPGKKAPECDLIAEGYFLGSLYSIHEYNYPVLWVKRHEFNCWFGRSPMALAAVFICYCGLSQIEIEMGKTHNFQLEREFVALHPSRALITVFWETGCTWVSQASPVEVPTPVKSQ